MRIALISLMFWPAVMACATDDETSDETEECFSDEDCPADQRCVITHDHEGDDHDHGGDCEEAE